MKHYKHRTVISSSIRHTVVSVISAILISGCSGSGSSQPTIATNESAVELSDTGALMGTNNSDAQLPVAGSSDSVGSDTGISPETNDSAPEASDIVDTTDEQITNDVSDGVEHDSTAIISTRVDFEITVPAYMSDSLNVLVVWGSKELSAQWVGDEYWAVSDIFPTDVTLPLVVTFTDGNGDVVLGSYEEEFTTGSNASEIYTIGADQFNTDQWDIDGDSVSNLSESIAGTNPLIVESEPLEVRDAYYESVGTLASAVLAYEEMMPSLPHFEHAEEIIPLTWNEDYTRWTRGLSEILTIDLDETGTGTFYDYYSYSEPSDVTVEDQSATRTNTGYSIIYVTNYLRTNSGAGVRRDIENNIETTAIDSQRRTQTGTISNESIGYSDSSDTDVSFTLTGSLIENESICSPEFGIYTLTRQYRYIIREYVNTTISKSEGDEYWNVTVTTDDGSVVEEYLVRSLGRNFVCDYIGMPIPEE